MTEAERVRHYCTLILEIADKMALSNREAGIALGGAYLTVCQDAGVDPIALIQAYQAERAKAGS